jgi:predicted permease
MSSSSSLSSLSSSFYETVITTFLASVKSVGTACTLASIGIYLHQRGFVVGNGKRTLALISQQVTIPLLFFTKILYCNQDWSSDPCPNVTDSLGDAWILLVWPIWVCSTGLFVGYLVTVFANVPKHQRNSIMASVAFGNSTGLPITLLTVIHSNFGSSSVLGSVDPTLFLSVYLVMYPVLQWGIGGMLLAPPPTKKKKKKRKTSLVKDISVTGTEESSSTDGDGYDDEYDDDDTMEAGSSLKRQLSMKSSIRNSLAHNVINRKKNEKYQINHRGLESVDASMYISIQENLNRWGKPVYGTAKGSFDGSLDGLIDTYDDDDNNNTGGTMNMRTRTESGADIGMDISNSIDENDNDNNNEDEDERENEQESSALLTTTTTATISGLTTSDNTKRNSNNNISNMNMNRTTSLLSLKEENVEKLFDTIRMVLKRCFQPPVISALLGLLFASIPTLRGILVDIDDRNGTAPFQWFFDGLYEIGRSAVPINMMILGCNLSASYMLGPPVVVVEDDNATTAIIEHSEKKFFSNKASLYVVIGKMIIMPIIGVLSTLLLQTVYSVPEEIAGGLYLVLLIVFLCPTGTFITLR